MYGCTVRCSNRTQGRALDCSYRTKATRHLLRVSVSPPILSFHLSTVLHLSNPAALSPYPEPTVVDTPMSNLTLYDPGMHSLAVFPDDQRQPLDKWVASLCTNDESQSVAVLDELRHELRTCQQNGYVSCVYTIAALEAVYFYLLGHP